MKAAILGMGAMGQIHKQVYEAAGVEVWGVDPKENPSLDFIKAMEWADIVSICSPDNYHTDQICMAFDMGKHVFCEKPLCHTREEFEAIKAAYNGQALGMNFPLRWHRPFVDAKSRLRELGDIEYIHCHYEYGRAHKMDGWRGDMNYNIVMGGGIHFIDLLLWFGFEVTPGFSVRDEGRSAAIIDIPGCGLCALTCDFTAETGHARRLFIEGANDIIMIDDREPTDKGRALKEFLNCIGRSPRYREMFDVPSPEDIFRVHEIGLGL